MAGRQVPKPAEERQRRNKPKVAPLALVGEITPPAPPSGLSKKWLERWAGFWSSEVGRAAAATSDLAGLERLFENYADRDSIKARLRKLDGNFDEGVQQYVYRKTNDLRKVEGQIQEAEDRFGLNPRARLAIGLALTQARRELEDLIGSEGGMDALQVIDSEAGGDKSLP